MRFFFLLFPFAEIFVFYRFSQVYSFFDALLLLFLSGALGILVVKIQGRSTLLLLQKDLAQGKIPANQILHRSFVILGAILLIIPGFISDVMGLAAILPGTRHLMVLYAKFLAKKGLLRGQAFVNGFQFRHGNFDFRSPFPGNGPVEKEAQVVDIEPIEITHSKKDPDQN
ncbi:MAG: FxsA family protein [Pseudobdellovibrionaceae bacterium]